MKRIISALLTLATLILLPFALSSCSDKSGNLIYSLNSDGESYSVTHEWHGDSYSAEEFRFPDTYKGKPVTSVWGLDADSRSFSVNKVIIPASVKNIGGFSGAWSIKEVFFEDGSQCEYIHSNAFSDCEFLEKINIPETVRKIDESAFRNCRNLKEISIPKNLTQLGKQAFQGCGALQTIVLPNAVTQIEYATFQYCNSLSITLPENLKTIGNNAFEYCGFSTIEIPDSVESIGAYAFSNCANLTSITLPASLQKLEMRTFEFCTKLQTVNFDKDSLCTTIEEGVFNKCETLKTLTLPNTLTDIKSNAFKDCTALTDIAIPDSLERLETELFLGCKGLSTIRFGENSKCKFIGKDAFKNCTNLSTVYIENLTKWCNIQFENDNSNPLSFATVLSVNGNTTDFVIPKEVTKIPASAFKNLSELKTVTFETGSKCQSIGANAFYACPVLQAINFASNGVYNSIGEYAFANCPSLTTFKMPVSIKTVGKYAFYDTNNLTQVSTDDLTAWCGITFGNDDANPASKAGNLYCGGEILRTLTIPNQVTEIGAYTFLDFQDLTMLNIPSSIKKIGEGAFSSRYITAINIQSVSAWCEIEFGDWRANPVGRSTLHLNGEPITDITIPATVKEIKDYTFSGCFSLKTVRIEKDGVNAIGEEAFSGCDELTEIYIPFSVKTIGAYAFGECEKLTIYTQHLSAPSGWNKNWNPLNRPVEWDLFQ